MAVTQRPQQTADDKRLVDGRLVDGQDPHQPDEDGPHDVPDDKVIEKTLPSNSARDKGSCA